MKKNKQLFNLLIKFVCLIFVVTLPFKIVNAGEFDRSITEQEKATFREMFKPLLSLFNMFKFLASIVAGVYLAWGAINLIMSGDDFKKRETAKQKLAFAVLGMMIIWGIPYFMQFMFLT